MVVRVLTKGIFLQVIGDNFCVDKSTVLYEE